MSATDFTLSAEDASSLQRVGRRTGLEPSVARTKRSGLVGAGGVFRFAYADPPYIGCAKRHYTNDPSGIAPEEVNHKELIEKLMTFDAWALSTHSPGLRELLPMCPDGVKVGAWVKPFVPFMGRRTAMAWEPVIYFGERGNVVENPVTVRDWVAVMPPVFTGKAIGTTRGQKPQEFCEWMFNLIGLTPEDELHDMFPGSGAVTHYWKRFCAQACLSLGGGGAEHGDENGESKNGACSPTDGIQRQEPRQ